MKVGLYFGTFNPVHVGHVILANHMLHYTDMDEIWMVVTPHNPHKKKSTLLENYHRLEMVYKATEDFEHIHPTDIEFKLKQPNYTIDTLVHISEKFPNYDFGIIMGEDNLKSFHKWKNYEVILEHYQVFVYPRIGSSQKENDLVNHPKVKVVEAPIIEISSTFIRNAIKNGKSVKHLLPCKVWEYIDLMNFYK
ncbi:nicotinate (nicotinamide) nucleotide adenylyltransferase [Wenyingzhuangia sp. 2_MG-2023]|uniref:nicotinate (nicotinamide) nucleotide adenylyltransferase n=1 Tax=Wenyingzhuangia sp. 2_MG-2023 TaxID=3062639 RepID=UPI0026E2DF67|nr:nicotinate (nicotinamide) nucleotide adenylyltransferase [Wenyingzhuangia sp. 2_MG-2023]MDO6737721.1 nicotinate (nicotinamide) nucleotide adenylyltransferase [Wenyingzhuangia sp. 2_MG-2023]MDO6802560.1 nicotinate (nicotinamide) nucleotide adenylyltransferase [Wenyingzhuangia sp. 1_MG-2023]